MLSGGDSYAGRRAVLDTARLARDYDTDSWSLGTESKSDAHANHNAAQQRKVNAGGLFLDAPKGASKPEAPEQGHVPTNVRHGTEQNRAGTSQVLCSFLSAAATGRVRRFGKGLPRPGGPSAENLGPHLTAETSRAVGAAHSSPSHPAKRVRAFPPGEDVGRSAAGNAQETEGLQSSGVGEEQAAVLAASGGAEEAFSVRCRASIAENYPEPSSLTAWDEVEQDGSDAFDFEIQLSEASDAEEGPDTDGEGPGSDPETDPGNELTLSSTGTALAPCGEAEASAREVTEIREWLEDLGCAAHAAAFEKASPQAALDWTVIAILTDADLRELGVASMGPRRKILAAIEQRNRSAAATAPSQRQALAPREESTAVMGHSLPSGAENCPPPASREARPLPQSGLKRSCITDFFATRSGSRLQRPPSPPRGGKAAVTKAGKSNRRPMHAGEKGRVPSWQKVPGTSFVVDRFGRAVESNTSCKSWFLTHFHADHYGGLSGRFNSGTIYCTAITARLVNARLNVPMTRMKIVELNTPILVEGARATFLDANHCPGAAMILFEVPGKRPVLHCGDCRCHPGMQDMPVLQKLRGGGLDLYLDTTYCSPEYDFPSQKEVLEFVIDAFKAEKYNQGKTLFLIGSYTIGKERLFLEAARILQQKIYVSRAKRKVLEALDLPREYRVLLTENDREATIQAVPMGMVNLKRMANIAKHYRARFTTIVGIQPTGWTHSAARGRASRGRRLQKGSLILYSVPYSEHSSFRELRDFVRWLQPVNLVPTVGNDGGPKTSRMLALLRQ